MIDLPLHADGIARAIGALREATAELLVRAGIAERHAARVLLPAPGNGLEQALEAARACMHASGIIAASRREPIAVTTGWDGPQLAVVDRSAVRALGIRITKVHLCGLVTDADGVARRVWLARRSADRRTAPLHLDTLVAGGQPAGIGLRATLALEADEEAGLGGPLLARAVETDRIAVLYPGEEGPQHERLIGFDLALPEAFRPLCRDGEIDSFELVGMDELARRLAGADRFKHASRLVLERALARWRAAGR